MTDENTNASEHDDAAVKKEDVDKKLTAAKKKIKETDSKNTDTQKEKKNIIEKLKAMGVMGSPKNDTETGDAAGNRGMLKVMLSVSVVILVVGSFVWALNKEANNEQAASNTNNVEQENHLSMPPAFPTYQNNWHPSSYNQNNNANYKQQQERFQQQRAQHQKWLKQQQEAAKQQRAEYQKWAQQQQQAQKQYRLQQQQRAQQQQAQQRSLQEKWAQQQQVQQPQTYYGYPQYGNNGTSPHTYYNYQPWYQQPGQYYRR